MQPELSFICKQRSANAYATVFAKRLTVILSSHRYVIINDTIQDIHVLRILF